MGDLFVLLGGDGVTRRPFGLARLGDTFHYRAVGRGGELRDARTAQLTLAGNDLKPEPPVQLEATGGWGANVTLSWQRRTNDTAWDTLVTTWRKNRLELYVDGISRASSAAANTATSDAFGIYRWGWGFSTNQDFNGDIA